MGLTTVMIFRYPGVAAGMLLCTYGLEQWTQAKSMWFFSHGTITNYVTGGLTLLAMAVATVKRKPVFKTIPKEYWAMAAIFLWALITVLWSVDPAKGWENWSYTLPFFLVFGFFAPLVVNDRADLKAMLLTLLTLGFAICTLLLTTTEWNERNVVLDSSVMFAAGDSSLGNPLAIAQLGSEVALAALLMNFRGTARFWQVLRYVVFGVGIAVAVKSGSRGQAVGLIMLGIIFLPFSRRFRDVKGFIGFASSLVVVGTIALMIFKALTAKSAGPDRWSVDSFIDAYSDGRIGTSLELLKHWAAGGPVRWVLGLGSSASYKYLGIYPHVVVSEVLGELGFIGLIILGIFTVYSVRTMRALWPYARESDEDRGLVAALAAIYLFEVLMSFKQGSLLSSGTMFAMGITLARMLAFYRREVALYEQLDAGGYAMSSDEREHEYDDIEEPEDEAAYPGLQPARV